jgi:acid phosphatase family membrane protein YuiD
MPLQMMGRSPRLNTGSQSDKDMYALTPTFRVSIDAFEVRRHAGLHGQ